MSDHAEGSVSDEDYEVEGIVGHKDSSRKGRRYEVKWKGYKETTFEPRENLLPNSKDLLADYDKKHPFKKLKVSTRSRSKGNKERNRKSRKSEVNTSQSEEESTDSNIENKKPNVETKRKRKSSNRLKTKNKSSKKNRKKESARAKKVVKASTLRNRKKKGRKKSRMRFLKSSSESSGEEEYEVELLLKHKDVEDERMYLVKWKGYRKAEATWEPSKNLSCRTLVRQYEHLRGKWKRPRKRSGSSDQPSKRMRTQGDNSNDDSKEEGAKKQVRKRLIKKKDGTWSNVRADDNAEKVEAKALASGDEKEKSSGDKNEKKKEDLSKADKHKKVSKADADLDIAGDEKSEDKGETKDEVEKTKIPEGEKGSQDERKTGNNSPQGKQDKSPEGKKREEDQKQVEGNNKE